MTAHNFEKINLLEAYNSYLLDALVMHIYKNVLYWKFLLITNSVILLTCIDPLVKHLMNLTALLTIWKNL